MGYFRLEDIYAESQCASDINQNHLWEAVGTRSDRRSGVGGGAGTVVNEGMLSLFFSS